jgi:hypothetical protein
MLLVTVEYGHSHALGNSRIWHGWESNVQPPVGGIARRGQVGAPQWLPDMNTFATELYCHFRLQVDWVLGDSRLWYLEDGDRGLHLPRS